DHHPAPLVVPGRADDVVPQRGRRRAEDRGLRRRIRIEMRSVSGRSLDPGERLRVEAGAGEQVAVRRDRRPLAPDLDEGDRETLADRDGEPVREARRRADGGDGREAGDRSAQLVVLDVEGGHVLSRPLDGQLDLALAGGRALQGHVVDREPGEVPEPEHVARVEDDHNDRGRNQPASQHRAAAGRPGAGPGPPRRAGVAYGSSRHCSGQLISPSTWTSGSSTTPKRWWTLRRASAITSRMSEVVAPPVFSTKFACF